MKIYLFIVLFLTLITASTYAEESTRLDLDECIRIALNKNKNILSAEQSAVKTYAQIDENKALAYPDIYASADYTRIGNIIEYELNGRKFSFTPEDNYKIYLNLKQKVYAPQIFEAIKASKSFAKAAELQIKIVKTETVSKVKKAYYFLILAKELIKINEESILQLQRNVEDVKKRYKIGMVTDYDLLRAEVQLANAMPALTKAKYDYEIALTNLKMIMGMKPSSSIKIDGKLNYLPLKISIDKAINNAIDRRAEIEHINHTIETYDRYLKITKKETLPTLTMHGDVTYANNEISSGGKANWKYQWNIGITLDYKLFDGGGSRSKKIEALSDLTKARINKDQLISKIHVEVKTAFSALMETDDLIASQEKGIEKAERAYEIATARNENGLMTQLELMDVQLALTTARINYSKSIYEYLAALTDLQKAMGTILEDI